MTSDLVVTKASIEACAKDYRALSDDHAAFGALTDRLAAVKVEPASEQAADKCMANKDRIVAAARDINAAAARALNKLATAMEEAHVAYRAVERDGVAAIQDMVAADFAGFGDVKPIARSPYDYESTPWAPNPYWRLPSQSLNTELPHDFSAVLDTQAGLNLDFPGLAHAASLGVFELLEHVSKVCSKDGLSTMERVQKDWIAAYQFGTGLTNEGQNYTVLGGLVGYDKYELEQRWEGRASEVAAATTGKVTSWLGDAGSRMTRCGQDIEAEARTAVFLKRQVAYLIDQFINLVPAVAVGLAGIGITGDWVNAIWGILTKDWGKVWAALGDTLLRMAALFVDAIGAVVFIWSCVMTVAELIESGITSLTENSLNCPVASW